MTALFECLAQAQLQNHMNMPQPLRMGLLLRFGVSDVLLGWSIMCLLAGTQFSVDDILLSWYSSAVIRRGLSSEVRRNLTSPIMPGDQQQSQTSDNAGTTPMQQPQTDWRSIADAAASIPNALYVSRADRTYQGEASGRGALCSFIRSHRSCMIAGIAVMLSLVCVGLAPLTFINKEEISQLSTTVDVFKRDQDDMSTTVDALKRDRDDMRQLATTVDALKRDRDDMRRDLDKERNRTATLEQRLHEMSKTPDGPESGGRPPVRSDPTGRRRAKRAANCLTLPFGG
uniref:Uncharacterized protein n=1 Tax=Branchiostoma floridae TaxID=7739 RepID=C3ZP34_BRAFL|eukprot:XP_002589758.1 hypothetical protein BRAFLDRAFT_97808 [Branchiostoma floridae]